MPKHCLLHYCNFLTLHFLPLVEPLHPTPRDLFRPSKWILSDRSVIMCDCSPTPWCTMDAFGLHWTGFFRICLLCVLFAFLSFLLLSLRFFIVMLAVWRGVFAQRNNPRHTDCVALRAAASRVLFVLVAPLLLPFWSGCFRMFRWCRRQEINVVRKFLSSLK